MLILGDESQHHGKFPWVTCGLVVVNVLCFCLQQFIGERFTNGFSLVPLEIKEMRDLTKPEQVRIKIPTHLFYDRQDKQVRTGFGHTHVTIQHYHGPFPIVLTLLTSMFLHGDWMHLIGNMWFLAVFGRNVECAFDHGRFLAFYLTCGVAGGLAHFLSDTSSVIPLLGASGAISGIMGAYVAIYPLNKIKIWFGWLIGTIELPALAVVGFWFLVQYVSAFMELETGVHDGIAYWDHLGGFGMGLAIVWGTVFYLKWQQARAPEVDSDTPEDATLAPLVPVANAVAEHATDPLADFLPTAITARPPTGIRQASNSESW